MKPRSIVEKATYLNKLICQKYPHQMKQGQCPIDRIAKSYNRNIAGLCDSLIWSRYGIHYTDYCEFRFGELYFNPGNPELEAGIDSKIKYYEKELHKRFSQYIIYHL